MKKLIVLSIALFTLYFTASAQPESIVKPGTITIKLDSTSGGDTLQLAQYLTVVNAWFNGCGADGLALMKQGKELGLNVKDIFKGLPLPTTTEGVTAWADRINLLFGGLGSIVVTLLTFGFSLFKKDPEKTITAVQNIFNKIRTRYLLAFSALVVSGIGAFYFNDGKFNLQTVVSWLGMAIGVTVGGVGIKGVLEMAGINLAAKKV